MPPPNIIIVDLAPNHRDGAGTYGGKHVVHQTLGADLYLCHPEVAHGTVEDEGLGLPDRFDVHLA